MIWQNDLLPLTNDNIKSHLLETNPLIFLVSVKSFHSQWQIYCEQNCLNRCKHICFPHHDSSCGSLQSNACESATRLLLAGCHSFIPNSSAVIVFSSGSWVELEELIAAVSRRESLTGPEDSVSSTLQGELERILLEAQLECERSRDR